jgi:hypothetical protein
VHSSSTLSSGCFEKLHTVLRLLRRLGANEPVRSVTAAVEQMIGRISALVGQPGATSVGTIGNDQSSMSPESLPAVPAAIAALDPLQDTLTPVDWDPELSLDDLWSMMDWNVGFPEANPILSTSMAEM